MTNASFVETILKNNIIRKRQNVIKLNHKKLRLGKIKSKKIGKIDFDFIYKIENTAFVIFKLMIAAKRDRNLKKNRRNNRNIKIVKDKI